MLDDQKINKCSIDKSLEKNIEMDLLTEENLSLSNENDFSKIEMVKLIRKNINYAISEKYNNNEQYKLYQIETLISNKYCHLNSIFHDIILDHFDELLKRFYLNNESVERIPKISNYYKNYLKFFCKPVFRNFFFNKLIQIYGDNKAELYYKNNYGGKRKVDEDYNNESMSSNKIKETFNNIFSDSIKEKIGKNSLTQSEIKNDINSTLLLEEIAQKWRLSNNGSPRFIQDVSSYSFKSIAKASRQDSLINDILCNLDKNIIESSINGRIIDKLHKNKRLNDNFSTTDKTKAEETSTKKSNSITKQVTNEIISTIFQNSGKQTRTTDIMKKQIYLLKMNKIKNYKEVNLNVKDDNVIIMKMNQEEKKNVSSNKHHISSSILNDNLKSPKSNPKSKGISTTGIKKKLSDNDVIKNIKSPTHVKNIAFKPSRINEYKNFRIIKPKNLEYQSKNLISKEMKKNNTNQSGSNNVYSANSLTPSLNQISCSIPNINDIIIQKEKFLSNNIPDVKKLRNKAEVKLDSNSKVNFTGRDKISIKKATINEKFDNKSNIMDTSLINKSMSNSKNIAKNINISRNFIKDENVKKVTLSLYTKNKDLITNNSKSPSSAKHEKINSFSKELKCSSFFNFNNLNVKSPENKIKSFNKDNAMSNYVNFHIKHNSRNKTEKLKKQSSKVYQTLQNLDKMTYQINLNLNDTPKNKSISKIYGSCANFDLKPQPQNIILNSKFESKLTIETKDKIKSPITNNFSSRIPINSNKIIRKIPVPQNLKIDVNSKICLKSQSSNNKNLIAKFQ